MRGSPGLRFTMGIAGPLFLLLCALAVVRETAPPWRKYQSDFRARYLELLERKAAEAKEAGDEKEVAKLERLKAEAAGMKEELKQIYVPAIGAVDHCTTCHAATDNPLFADEPQPFRSHSGDYLKTHQVARFGCTVCHGGLGVGSTVEAAHGLVGEGTQPMLPVKYAQARCARCHEIVQGLAGAEVAAKGEVRFVELGCEGCHRTARKLALPKFAPSLSTIKGKIEDRRWLAMWVSDPTKAKEDTVMPHFFLKEDEVRDLLAFLDTMPEQPPLESVSLAGASSSRGENLFKEKGCRGCHAVEPQDKSVSRRVPHLAGIGVKVSVEWLDRWIADPKKYNPATPMPKLELTEEERRDIVAYLAEQKQGEEKLADFAKLTEGGDPEKGKKLVEKMECFGCHEIKGFEKTPLSVPDLSEFAARPVEELDFGEVKGVPRTKWDWLVKKLAEPRAYERENIKLRMPVVKLSEEDVRALVTYVLSFDGSEMPAAYTIRATPATEALLRGRLMVAHLHCRGCHEIEGEGGNMKEFVERKTWAPPTLTGEGARVQPQWLFEYLKKPEALRPWLKVRMPNFDFDDASAEALVDYFSASAGVESRHYVKVDPAKIDQHNVELGASVFRVNKCMQCHPASIEQGLPKDVDPDDLSINLALTKKRLRPEWVREFLRNPKKVAGLETRMPLVFYDIDGYPKVPEPERRIDAVTDFMMAVDDLEAHLVVQPREEEEIDWSTYEY